MDENIKIDSVFEEKYCICGHYSIDKFTSITDSFIKYREKLISLVEIIRETLCFEPALDNLSLEICEPCKTKVLDFYNFKMTSSRSRENLRKSSNSSETVNAMELKDYDNPTTEYKMLDIIRSYIKTYSINRIEIEESSKKFLVISGCSEQPMEGILEADHCESIEPVKNTIEESEKVDISEESEYEYLEEFLDDDSNDRIDSIDHENLYEKVVEFQQDDDTSTIDSTATQNSSSLKRSRHPEEWKCNKRKSLRNSGKSYLNSKGNIVKERELRESCAVTNCRSKCQARLTENDRLMNFENYWKLGNIIEQRKFIYNHIQTKEPSRRKSIQSNRTITSLFYLDALDSQGNQVNVRVCKKMFKNTLAISNQLIQGAIKKFGHTEFKDFRGKHERKTTESHELAQQHVQNFPFFYVEQNMTIVQLYNMYVDECKKNDIRPLKEANYRKIFDKYNTNSFLKTVPCVKCNQYFKRTDEERHLLQKEHNQHLEESKKCKDNAHRRQKRSKERLVRAEN